MKNYFLPSLTALCSLSGTLAAALPAPEPAPTPHTRESELNQNNDHGMWLVQDVNIELSDKWSGKFHFEQRLGSQYRLWWYYEYELVLQYNLTKQFEKLFGLKEKGPLKSISFGPGFNEFNQILRNTKGEFKWVWGNKIIIEANATVEVKDWSIKQRAKVEFISYNHSNYREHITYRYRIGLYFPWKFTCLEIAPFISNEFFFRENTWSRNHTTRLVGGYYEDRLRVGLTAVFVPKKFTGEVWWQYRPLKQPPTSHPRWNNTFQYGVSVIFSF